MEIYEFAMKMEKDGEQYYLELAQNAVNAGFKNIFTILAHAEAVHYDIFRKMRDNEKIEVPGTKLLSEVRNIFEKIREEEKDADVLISQIDLYRKAREIENKSIDFYLTQADEMRDPYQKEIFVKIADEEKKHFFIMEEIINFVAQPGTWLENPEWYHTEI